MKTIQRFLLRLLLLALLVLAVILGVRYLTTGKGIKSLFGFGKPSSGGTTDSYAHPGHTQHRSVGVLEY